MIYLKSIVAGIIAVVSFAVLVFLCVAVYMWRMVPKTEGAVGWDPISIVRTGPLLSILVVFLLGFIWEFRRGSR